MRQTLQIKRLMGMCSTFTHKNIFISVVFNVDNGIQSFTFHFFSFLIRTWPILVQELLPVSILLKSTIAVSEMTCPQYQTIVVQLHKSFQVVILLNGMEWLYYPRFDSITQSSQSVSRKRPREVKAPPIVSATEDFFGNSLLSIQSKIILIN